MKGVIPPLIYRSGSLCWTLLKQKSAESSKLRVSVKKCYTLIGWTLTSWKITCFRLSHAHFRSCLGECISKSLSTFSLWASGYRNNPLLLVKEFAKWQKKSEFRKGSSVRLFPKKRNNLWNLIDNPLNYYNIYSVS